MSSAGESRPNRGNPAAAVVVVLLIAAVAVVRWLPSLVATLAAGGAIYYVFAPLCAWLAKRRVPRLASVLGIALLLVGAVVVSGVALVPRIYSELEDFVVSLPQHLAALELRLAASGLLGEGADPRLHRATDAVIDRAGAIMITGLERTFGFAMSAFGSVTAVLLGLALGFYLLFGAADLGPGLAGWVPPAERERFCRFGRDVSRAVGGYVRARVLAAIFIGVSYFVAYALIGVHQALLLAVVGGLLDLVPVIGPLLAAAPALAVAAFQGVGTMLAVVAVQIVAQQIESSALDPLLAGRMVRLPPSVMVLAVATGAATAGIAGMLVAVPLAAAARSALAVFYRERWAEVGG
jgi:predicted PurR-regulated permease PerM